MTTEVIEMHQIGIDPWPDAAWDAVCCNDIILHDCGAASGYIEIKTKQEWLIGKHGDFLCRMSDGSFEPRQTAA